mmetsp:Transcript_57538/g.134778  ORF Transcript_57538/g.134778 Transcript_57538/m.134778 type:complete len:214 (+) Transcript_57538:1549-2190(+)
MRVNRQVHVMNDIQQGSGSLLDLQHVLVCVLIGTTNAAPNSYGGQKFSNCDVLLQNSCIIKNDIQGYDNCRHERRELRVCDPEHVGRGRRFIAFGNSLVETYHHVRSLIVISDQSSIVGNLMYQDQHLGLLCEHQPVAAFGFWMADVNEHQHCDGNQQEADRCQGRELRALRKHQNAEDEHQTQVLHEIETSHKPVFHKLGDITSDGHCQVRS